MNEMGYKPNSHKFKEEQQETQTETKRVEKVVRGPVKTKKNEMRKLSGTFLAEDLANVKSYILMDVLVPTIKKVLVDIISDSASMIFLGKTKGSSSNNTSTSKVSYQRYYDPQNTNRFASENQMKSRFDYDDLVFNTRGEAEAVREEMQNVIERYGYVSVADLYDMVELTQPYTSNKYGWTNISSAEVVRVYEGYMLKLPKARPLN